MKLFTRYLNSAAYYSSDEPAAKTPVEIEREKIAATMAKVEPEKEEEKEEGQQQEEEANQEEEAKEEDNTEEDDSEEEEEKETPANETEEQKQERLAAERLARKEARMQKRIDKLTAELNMTKGEKDKLQKQLEAKPDANLTEEEVQARAEKLAADMVKQRSIEQSQQEFQKEADALQADAIKADKEFMKNINATANEAGAINAIMIGILRDLDNGNGGEVLAYLAKNIDDYEDINGLTEGRMTAKLIRLSDKLKAEKEAAKAAGKKERSKAPPPIEPVNEGRGAQSSTVLPSNPTKSAEDMEKFVRIRNEQTAARRKANGGLL